MLLLLLIYILPIFSCSILILKIQLITCCENVGVLSFASRTVIVTVAEAVDTGVPLSVATTVKT